MTNIQIRRTRNNAAIPAYATDGSAGMDLCAAVEADIIVPAGGRKLIPTGLSIALPDGFEAQIRPRSGLAWKNGITVLNTPGTIDADYRGEIGVILLNTDTTDFTVTPGMRIAQMIIARYEKITWQTVEELDDTSRGEGGFGSTGIKG